MRLGSGPDRILVIGSVHGNEPEGVDLAQRLVAFLRGNPSLLVGRSLLVVRDANPDGNQANSRTNARGVDLNRNFPARNWQAVSKGDRGHSGSRPASEPETQALLKLLAAFRPHRIVAIHSTGGEAMVNYDGPAESLARAMARHNRYQVSDYIGYPTPGSLGTYAGRDGQIPIITLELPRGIDAEQAWRQNRDALVQAIRFTGTGPHLTPVHGQPLPQASLAR
jgi:protein MpaA